MSRSVWPWKREPGVAMGQEWLPEEAWGQHSLIALVEQRRSPEMPAVARASKRAVGLGVVEEPRKEPPQALQAPVSAPLLAPPVYGVALPAPDPERRQALLDLVRRRAIGVPRRWRLLTPAGRPYSVRPSLSMPWA